MKMRNKKHIQPHKPKNINIRCSCCGHYYALMDETQGHDCASYIYPDNEGFSIYSHYGSGFDTSKFNVINQKIINTRHMEVYKHISENKIYDDKKLVICDNCIESNLEKGNIKQDTEYNFWAPIQEMQQFNLENPEAYFNIMKNAGPENCIALIREERAKLLENKNNLQGSRMTGAVITKD